MHIAKHVTSVLAAVLPGQASLQALSSGLYPQQAVLSSTTNEKHAANSQAIVLWHGLGDRYNSEGIRRTKELISELIPGAYVYSVGLDDDPDTDERRSLFGNANLEVDLVCDKLSNITELQNGFGAIGFSQGGLFLRALVERCASVSVSHLVTFGSPHMGVSELPICQPVDNWACKQRNAFLKSQVWKDSVQKTVIPAQYFRDPAQYDKYLEHSNFLADINNERSGKSGYDASMRLQALQKLVLIMFDQDTTVVPKESAFFQDTDPSTGEIQPITHTRVYAEDLIGLRTLHEEGRIAFHHVDDEHMRFSDEFLTEIIQKYFAPK